MGALRRLGRRFRGCTIVELCLVAAAFVGLAGIGHIPSDSRTELFARKLELSAEEFFARNPRAKRCSLDDLVKQGFYDGPRQDAWGRGFRFTCVRDRVAVTSAGEDGAFGTCDDIRSGEPWCAGQVP